jgi:tripartite-type tricarboxylate transporter receptor subunit TctC
MTCGFRALFRFVLRRSVLMLVLLAVALPALGGRALAQPYPSRTVTLVVPSPPGGGTDTSWRIIEPKLSALLGQKVVIENRPGASGNIGAAYVAKAPPDGYTLLALISSHVINQSVMKDIPYDIERDFSAISRSVLVPGVFVSPASLPAKTLKELIALLKANPGRYNFASAGQGSMSQLMIELFLNMADLRMVHVPYRGTAPAFNDVLAGHVALMSADLLNVTQHLQAGSVRAYAITSAERSAVAPDLPTVAEAGLPGYEAMQWFGLVAPAGTPPEIVGRLHAAVVTALNDPEIRNHFLKDGTTPAPSASPAEFAAFIRAERLKWAAVVEKAGLAAK